MKPAELPLLSAIEDSTNHQDYLKQKAKIEQEIEDYKAGEVAKLLDELRPQAGEYMLGAAEADASQDSAKFENLCR